ncbi:MAG: hypothetical protein HN494_02275 [Opitutae bacterium]|nr:hypothetical protein [Opitutae bacterium]MBT7923438.1 hypothetical protein [Opitutae bacterium]
MTVGLVSSLTLLAALTVTVAKRSWRDYNTNTSQVRFGLDYRALTGSQ